MHGCQLNVKFVESATGTWDNCYANFISMRICSLFRRENGLWLFLSYYFADASCKLWQSNGAWLQVLHASVKINMFQLRL